MKNLDRHCHKLSDETHHRAIKGESVAVNHDLFKN